MPVYSSIQRELRDITENLSNPDTRDAALGNIFDALDTAIHKKSYAKVIVNSIHSAGMIESYSFISGRDEWEIQLQLNGQAAHNTVIYSSSNDGKSAVTLVTHYSVLILGKAQESK